MYSLTFLLKKIVAAILMPLSLFFWSLLIAVYCYYSGRRIAARNIAIMSVAAIYLLSLSPVAKLITSPLESWYPKYQNQPVSHVLVLGGSHSSSEQQPLSSLLSTTSLMRLTEGVNILKSNPESMLLLSGFKGRDQISNALAMSKVAQSFGVSASNIVLAEQVKDTSEEAKHWLEYLRSQAPESRRLALITSATHMPRSMMLFDKHLSENNTIDLVPAPTEFIGGGVNGVHWSDFFPHSANLFKVRRAWHEYLGIIWSLLN